MQHQSGQWPAGDDGASWRGREGGLHQLFKGPEVAMLV